MRCSRCGRGHRGPKRTCAACLEVLRTERQRRAEDGRCNYVACADPAAPGRRQCETHLALYRRLNRESRARKKEVGCVADPRPIREALDDYDAVL